ncbi:MAG: conjugal transfer protein TraG N-terminal domain-containing protein [Rickettsiaceae bacterium]|nr:conjugal transfer protein TraG N-terminal domain-containing protein [Rickettsiaceae bacterium]
MDYIIYTYGGGDLLVSVFNAIAMLFKSNNTYLTPVGTTALTLGGIYAGIKAIYKGDFGLIGTHWMMPSMIVFLVLFSPKTTVWIKDEVTKTAPIKIDNIPVGIAFFTHLSSSFSHHVSALIEDTMMPAKMNRSSTSGILYGAKATAKLRDVQISDPILLRNAKEYLRQCYMKPYVIGNFGGHRSKAIKAKDLLSYLEKYPAKCFGIKMTNNDGSYGGFMTCTEAGKIINEKVTAASREPELLSKFGAAIGMSSSNKDQMNQRITAMTSDIFKYLEQGQYKINKWMKQAMMLNANRESYDDWREKVGHTRIFPELVKMQATRGMFQQAMGSIVGGEMAEAMIPSAIQPTMMALVVMLFVIILPFALLPVGWTYIVTGVKLIIWVGTWPIFYTIIHCIAMIQLKDSIGAWGESGLSLVGQAGFTELIMLKYSTVQSLISATPLISFAVVFGSPYALSSIAGGLANVGASASIGSNMADGNLSMRQVSHNNATKGQQNLAPSLLMGGGVIDDGAIRIMQTADGKYQVLNEHVDQLSTNINGAESYSAVAAKNLANSQNNMTSITQRQTNIASLVESQAIDLAKKFSNGSASSSVVSLADQEALRNAFSTNSSTNQGKSVGDIKTTANNFSLEAGIPFGNITGLKASGGITASNSHDVRTDMSEQETQAYNTAMEHVKTAAITDSISSNSSEDMSLSESLGANLSEQEQIAEEKARTQQDIETYSNQISYAENNSGSINNNLNNEYLKNVMAEHPELNSKHQALLWTRENPSEAQAIQRETIKQNNPFETAAYKSQVQNIQKNGEEAKKVEIETPGSLNDRYNKKANEVNEKAVVRDNTGGEKHIKNVDNNSNLRHNNSMKNVLNDNLNPEEKEGMNKLNISKKNYEDTKVKINETKERTNGSVIGRTAQRVANGGFDTEEIIKKKIILPGFKNKE